MVLIVVLQNMTLRKLALLVVMGWGDYDFHCLVCFVTELPNRETVRLDEISFNCIFSRFIISMCYESLDANSTWVVLVWRSLYWYSESSFELNLFWGQSCWTAQAVFCVLKRYFVQLSDDIIHPVFLFGFSTFRRQVLPFKRWMLRSRDWPIYDGIAFSHTNRAVK